MPYTRPFRKISSTDVSHTGGKGASLGEMTRAGIPVPPGFVVLTSAFERFLLEADLVQEIQAELDKVNHQEIRTVEYASEHIQAMIKKAKMPRDIQTDIISAYTALKAKDVAVRSSATAEDSKDASWAGELDTYLHITKPKLLEHVKKCWASLFTPRAIFYRFEKGFHKKNVSVAVVIQEMVRSDVSGVAFSVHPVTQDKRQMILEAGWGLGEAIVSGQITPDSYVLDKKTWRAIDVNISIQERGIYRRTVGVGTDWKTIPREKQGKQKLSATQIVTLGKLIAKIEKHYGFPVDVEWAMKGRAVYITQSRPITTLT